MGSSYRQDLKRASDHDPVVLRLRHAGEILAQVYVLVVEEAYEEDQTDNAVDTGGLLEVIAIAKSLIDGVLPPLESERT